MHSRYSPTLWSLMSETLEIIDIKHKLMNLGIELDEFGHLFYHHGFKPVELQFELVFVRHGETYGNCGQVTATGEIDKERVFQKIKDKNTRIYQGDVDTEINQLTDEGKQQAENVAMLLNNHFLEKNWYPDIILLSPLTRSQQTAAPFIVLNQLEKSAIIYDDIKELSFGAWENKRVCDIPDNDDCHKFYRDQHALVKSNGAKKAECFAEALLRAHKVILDLNEKYAGKKIIMFSHSMFGAACCILLGRGQTVENGAYLAFDGKRKDGTPYTFPHATPVLLTAQVNYNLAVTLN
jgi:broad specificity phosphatase PhoE